MSAVNSAEVTISVRMQGAAFQSTIQTVEGATAPIVEDTIAAGATETMPGIAIPEGKIQLIYLLSDTNDCTVTFVGSGGNVTISLTAGEPYLWVANLGADPLSHYPISSMTVENLNTAGGESNVATTDFHARLILAQ